MEQQEEQDPRNHPIATVVLVTGAASGIGRAAALAFAAAPPERVPRPVAVVVADTDGAGGAETCRLITEGGWEDAGGESDAAAGLLPASAVDRTPGQSGGRRHPL
jgi:NAD(P)-dependent dehydrogenase (short-subunit alcohol dehydrogenase family)